VELTRQALTRDFSDDDVVRGDRNFYLGNEPVTPAAQAVVDELDRRSAPGSGSWSAPPTCASPPTAMRSSTSCSRS
jgi:hypothetical protein